MNAVNKILLAANLLGVGVLTAAIWHCAHLAPQLSRTVEMAPVGTELTTATAPKLRSYSELESAADWRQWIDQLRAEGVPTSVLARLAQAGFEDRWQKRQAQAQAAFMKGDW